MSAGDRATIGPYRIVSRVGAGGMGEVFKAWDPRLERDVAIKLLHPAAALDADRQRRLLAEGRAASALNHPNILRVYDADVDGTSYYLVSEWLEGKSLRDELSRGPLALRRLLDLSVQIADGLAAAHSIGIVHRDIKPENVMLARDGTARIVDFGLARPDPHASSLSSAIGHAATVSLEGGLSGTPAYMSPEQARGNSGDFRTDHFAFGALLYEMATGTFAFRRDSVADTLSAVLHEEPRPIADVNPRIPAPLRWTIERCLDKDANERYSATDDLARELRRVRDHLSEALAEPKPIDDQPHVVRSGWRPWLGLGAAAVIGGVAVLAALASTPAEPHLTFSPFATASEYEGEPSWSADGQTIAYAADVDGVLQVFVKRVGDALNRQVTQGSFDSSRPFWSPNGQRLYFISPAGERDGLWSVGVAGGRPELLLENVARAAIDLEGKRLALLRDEPDATLRQGLWWSSPPGAEPTRETRPPFDQLRTGGNGHIRFSRDGKLLVWVYDVDMVNQNNSTTSDFYIIPNGPGAPRKVLSPMTGTINLTPYDWMPDSRHIVVSLPEPNGFNRHLWVADTESDTMQQITVGHTNETQPVVSPTGQIAYASDEVDFDLVQIAPDGQGRRTMLATARNELDPAYAPAGDQYAFVTDRGGSIEIWARSRDGKWERPIVTQADFPNSPTVTLASLAFSPEGRTLAYQRGGEGTFEIWLSPANGGTPTRIMAGDEPGGRPWRDAPTWSPDGEWIAYQRNLSGRVSLAKTRIGTGETVELMETPLVFSRPAWSPDGKWIACQTPDRLVRVPADGGPPITITEQPILAVAWKPDSRHLAVLIESETSGHFALAEASLDSTELRLLNPDLGPIPVANQPIRGFSFAAKQGFLTSLASARSDIWVLEGFRQPSSWLDRLLRRRH